MGASDGASEGGGGLGVDGGGRGRGVLGGGDGPAEDEDVGAGGDRRRGRGHPALVVRIVTREAYPGGDADEARTLGADRRDVGDGAHHPATARRDRGPGPGGEQVGRG